EGMVVSTNGSTDQLRRTLTEMLLSEHLQPNPGGRPNELVDLANDLGVEASFEGRGPEARVVPTHGYSWLDTECELCGGCLSVCPTGAIHEQFLGGAPVDHERALHKVKTTCTFCGV